jgi:YNFM family putative membrane transporter
VRALSGFLLGSAGMFASLYSTQAILPELARDFHVTPSGAGLTVSAVIVAIAAGVWVWGPVSDRIGRRRSLLLASAALVVPTLAAGLAPTFETLLACRVLQGLCMPGLLVVGAPYVMEAFGPRLGARAMGAYVSSLVAGGLIGRVGVALLTSAVGWRWAISSVALLPAAAYVVMRRRLPDVGAPPRSTGLRGQLRNAQLLRTAAAGASMFFMFVGTFSYVTFRLESPPFNLDPAMGGLIFLLWVFGGVGPFVGSLVERIGWRKAAFAAVALAASGLLLTLPPWLPTLALALALLTIAMFSGATALQLGVAQSTDVDRGAANAVYFSVYYGAGALGGYLPGLAWQAWRWDGVVAVGLAATATAAVALLGSRGTAGSIRRVSMRRRAAA